MTPPETLNGYPVIAQIQVDPETWRIMCYRRGHTAHEYVVSLWSIYSPREWIQGHYFETFTMASEYYNSKIGS